MKRTWFACLLAIASVVTSVHRADAAYCGLASYQHGDATMTTSDARG
jgi:hypothetical protein